MSRTLGKLGEREVENGIDGPEPGKVNFYLIQFFKMTMVQKVDSTAFPHQDSAHHGAFHSFFECERWNEVREELE